MQRFVCSTLILDGVIKVGGLVGKYIVKVLTNNEGIWYNGLNSEREKQ
jgi:hypothetical protein